MSGDSRPYKKRKRKQRPSPSQSSATATSANSIAATAASVTPNLTTAPPLPLMCEKASGVVDKPAVVATTVEEEQTYESAVLDSTLGPELSRDHHTEKLRRNLLSIAWLNGRVRSSTMTSWKKTVELR